MSNVPERLFVYGPILETSKKSNWSRLVKTASVALREKNLSLNKYCPPMSFKISTTAEPACSQKSSVMESPQTRISNPGTGEPERPFARPEPGAARRALAALHNYGAA